jgi:purine-nucleoside phosphorylase
MGKLMGEKDELRKINESSEFLKDFFGVSPKTAIILGSGLGPYADEFEVLKSIEYSEIPNFEKARVKGHDGVLQLGKLKSQDSDPVVIMKGRYHYYEGYDLKTVVFPVRVMKFLGVKSLIVTNASGGLNPDFQPGELMLITDHINLMSDSPLCGENTLEFGPRFPDMTEAYDKELRTLALGAAKKTNSTLHQGVYAGMKGPAYETPAEVRMLRTIGADATGMSTVPEVIAAVHMGLRVLGISCITNLAAGINKEKLNHNEVIENSSKSMSAFRPIMNEILSNI